jgi:hypothetical protein
MEAPTSLDLGRNIWNSLTSIKANKNTFK